MTEPIEQWVVTGRAGGRHVFEDQVAALRYALDASWSDRGTTVTAPNGDAWCIMRRHRDVSIVVQRVC